MVCSTNFAGLNKKEKVSGHNDYIYIKYKEKEKDQDIPYRESQ